jgi:hypothetical protein
MVGVEGNALPDQFGGCFCVRPHHSHASQTLLQVTSPQGLLLSSHLHMELFTVTKITEGLSVACSVLFNSNLPVLITIHMLKL